MRSEPQRVHAGRMMRFNPPPNWPPAPAGWVPPAGWQPPAAWGPAPLGWPLWVQEQAVAPARATRAVSYQPVKTSHTFHLLMTVFTAGIWGVFVWLPITVINSLRRDRVVTKLR